MAFCPEHPKWDQDPNFTAHARQRASPFTCELPPPQPPGMGYWPTYTPCEAGQGSESFHVIWSLICKPLGRHTYSKGVGWRELVLESSHLKNWEGWLILISFIIITLLWFYCFFIFRCLQSSVKKHHWKRKISNKREEWCICRVHQADNAQRNEIRYPGLSCIWRQPTDGERLYKRKCKPVHFRWDPLPVSIIFR